MLFLFPSSYTGELIKKEKILADYKKILKVFPDAELSNTLNFLLIPGLPLPDQFNYSSTPMLIKLHPSKDYREPEAYVARELRVYGKRSQHLDENLTEPDMLMKGWVKLCVRVKWNPSFSLLDYLIMAIKFLENLRG
jgi:hypothetical protein